jgi:hypothetical protein
VRDAAAVQRRRRGRGGGGGVEVVRKAAFAVVAYAGVTRNGHRIVIALHVE